MIELERLYLKNFLSHRETEIEFERETAVIIGKNASGKTSILRGIYYAIFGEDLKFKDSNKESLINRMANSAYLEVDFKFRGDSYRVTRKLSRGRGSAHLYKEGKLVAEKITEVKRFLTESLGLEPHILKTTIFVPQGEITELFKGRPQERRRTLNKLLGLEEFAKKYAALNERLKELKRTQKVLIEKIGTLEELKGRREELQSALKAKREELQRVKESLKKLADEFKGLREQFEIKDREREEFEKLSERLASLKAREREVKEEVKKLEKKLLELSALKERAAELQKSCAPLKELKELYEKVKRAEALKIKEEEALKKERRLEEILKELPTLTKELQRVKEELKELQKELPPLEEKLRRKEEAQGRLKEITEREKRIRTEIEAIGAPRPKEVEELLKAKKEELERKREEALRIKQSLEELKQRAELLKSSGADCPVCKKPLSREEAQELLELLRREGRELKERFNSLKGEREGLKREVERLEALLQEEKIKAESLKSLKAKLAELLTEKEELQRAAAGVDEVRKKVKALRERILSLSRAESSLSQKLKTLKEEREALEPQIGILKEELKELELLKREVEGVNVKELKEKVLTLERKYESLKRIEGELRGEAFLRERLEAKRRELNSITAEIEEIEAKLKELKFEPELHRVLKESVERREAELLELNKREAKLKGEIEQIEKGLEASKRDDERLKTALETLIKVRDSLNTLSKVAQVVHPDNGFLRVVRSSLLPAVEKYSRELFELFGFEFSEIKIDEDLTVKVIVPGIGELSLEELSGGQQIAFAIALRFAMAKHFASGESLKTLILDEPTIHLDTERKLALTELLMKLKGSIPQMIIVTHDPELEVVADRVIKVEKVNGFSEVEVG